jgi:hypothetical protein
MSEAEISEKCYAILTNEVMPRAKKLGLTLNEFCDPTAAGALARLEYDGIITRNTLREILDERVEEIQKNDNIQES